MQVKSIQEIENALAPIAEEQGVIVYEVVFKKGRDASMTIYLDTDRPEGIDLNACEAFHLAADSVLDELDPTYGEPYTLNVSSLGLDRPFKTDRDYLRHVGQKVELKLYAPYKGEKHFEAILVEYNGVGGNVTLDKEGDVFKLNLTQIVKMSQAIEFD